MPVASSDSPDSLRSEGGLLPAAFLARVAHLDATIPGLSAEGYHLGPTERLEEASSGAWNVLVSRWERLGADPESGPPRLHDDTATRWSLPVLAALGYGWLQPADPITVGETSYPISHAWAAVPVHLVDWEHDLDSRRPVPGTTRQVSPARLLREALDALGDKGWGIVTNGRRLRLLRGGAGSRPTFVEFDLEAIFTAGAFPDFLLAWLTCHQSRLETRPQGGCWLDSWAEEAAVTGIRALDRLRSQVASAISLLGAGFLAHPANTTLRARLAGGGLSGQDYYRQLLRLVYRLIFCFVAEDRGLLHPPGVDVETRRRYRLYYSTDRLRRLAGTPERGAHGDLWQGLRVVLGALASEHGEAGLGLPALGGFLWSPEACPDLDGACLANSALLDATRRLAYLTEDRSRLRVDYRHLGSEELGGVYESLLDLHPVVDPDVPSFRLVAAPGAERKSTGSFYTHPSLVARVLDDALGPLLEDAESAADPESALLGLRICDPACGSGHFLVAAGRRIALHLARLRSGGQEPDPAALAHASRQVVGRCLYGVDRNDMAVELAKVALWLEALQAGLPLSFLDHQIAHGDALLGASPALVAAGIPDVAFKAVLGDEKDVLAARRRANRSERASRQGVLPGMVGLLDTPAGERRGTDLDRAQQELSEQAMTLAAAPDRSLADVAVTRRRWAELANSPTARRARLTADAFCLAFLAPKTASEPPITQALLDALASDPEDVNPDVRERIEKLAAERQLFHWHLAFPEVFTAPQESGGGAGTPGWAGGFDLVIGNPPWEKVKLSEREFFAQRHPEIAVASGAARKGLIAALADTDAELHQAYRNALRAAEADSHFLRNSGRYPLCGRGDVNTYAVFAEAMRACLAPTGRLGAILPTGIATDETTKAFFQMVSSGGELVSLYDFENRQGLFPEVHRSYKFCLLTLAGPAGRSVREASFAFFCHQTAGLDDQERRFALSAKELALLNPNTGTCPVFRSRRDAEITLAIYRRVPVLIREGDEEGNPWGVQFRRLFDMTNDSALFRGRAELEADGWSLDGNVFRRGTGACLPLYEAKMVHHFDHRWASYHGEEISDLTAASKADPRAVALPRYWVPEAEVLGRLSGREGTWSVGFRGIARPTDERTVIASVVPPVAAGNSLPLMLMGLPCHLAALLAASLSSLVVDFVGRQKVGGSNLNFFLIEQFPVLSPRTYERPTPWSRTETLAEWLEPRVLELTYTAWDLAGFAEDLGYAGPPFRWDEQRRGLLRADLDACFFHLYGLDRDDAEYVLGTFPIVARHDEAAWGEYRTSRLVLDAYDAMTKAAQTGEVYQGSLDPPAADLAIAHLSSAQG